MLDRTEAFHPHLLHRLWQLLPSQARRRALTHASALIAPRPDRISPPALHGLVVGGELSRATGLGEGARLMLQGAVKLGLGTWSLELGPPVREHAALDHTLSEHTSPEHASPDHTSPDHTSRGQAPPNHAPAIRHAAAGRAPAEQAAEPNVKRAPEHNVGQAAEQPAGQAAELPTSHHATPPDGAPLVLHINPPLLPLAMLRLGRRMLRGRRIIGYWAWELPIAPPDWRVGLKFVHEVWVPSRFTAAALDGLVPGRVRVVPHPLALAPSTADPDRAGFGMPPDTVTVLVSFNLASSFERKNPLAAIAAFRAAFGDRNDRLLVVKVGYPGHFPADLARLRAAIGQAANIRIDTETLSPRRSRALTASVDIVLSLHRSEGFGLVPAEAMLAGKPVIATGWSGNMDFMDASCAVPIGYHLVPVRDPRGVYDIPGAVWAEADPDEAVAQLRRLADDPMLRAEIGQRGRAAAMAQLTTAPLAEALRGLGLTVP